MPNLSAVSALDLEPRSLADRADDDLLRVATVAWYLRLDRSTVSVLLDRGALPHVRLGDRSRRVMVADLRAYLTAQRVPRPSLVSALHEHARGRRSRHAGGAKR